MITDKALTVLLPVYNEEEILEETVESLHQTLSSCVKDFEILIVDDGSKDKSGIIADRFAARLKEVSTTHHDRNYGFGQALRTGFKNAKNNLILMNPVDNLLHKHEVEKYIKSSRNLDIVAGFRPDRRDYSFFRLTGSICYRLMIRWFFGVKLSDIGWVTVYKKDVLDKIKPKSKGDFIMAEILIKARRKHFRSGGFFVHYEPRVTGQPTGNKISNILDMLREMFIYSLR